MGNWLMVAENSWVLWQPLITKTNSNITSKSLNRILSRNHKRTQQGVPDVLLSYLYNRYIHGLCYQ